MTPFWQFFASCLTIYSSVFKESNPNACFLRPIPSLLAGFELISPPWPVIYILSCTKFLFCAKSLKGFWDLPVHIWKSCRRLFYRHQIPSRFKIFLVNFLREVGNLVSYTVGNICKENLIFTSWQWLIGQEFYLETKWE